MGVPLSLALLVAACGSVADTAAATNAVAAVPTPAAGENAILVSGDFADFWSRFRQAALRGDGAALKAMSAATVLAHGELDDDPIRRLTPAQVPAAVAKVMAASDTLDAQGHTQRTLVQATERLSASDMDGRGEHRIGNFVFKAGAKGLWHLTDLYSGTE